MPTRPAGSSAARCSRLPASMAPAAPAACSMTWRRGRRGAVQRLRSGAPYPVARQYASGPRPGRLRVDQGHSVRAVLQSRQERRTQLPRLGLGHGLCLLRFPSPGRGADDDGAGGGPAAFAAGRRSRPGRLERRGPRCRRGSRPRRSRAPKSSRSNPRRNPSRRNRKVRRSCATRPTDGVSGLLSRQRLRRAARPACGTGSAGTASRSPPAPGLST